MIARFVSPLLAGLWALCATLRAQRQSSRPLITADEIEWEGITATEIHASEIRSMGTPGMCIVADMLERRPE